MPLTTAQAATLKIDIAADPVLSLLPNTLDNAFAIAAAYNAIAAWTVWKTNVAIGEVGKAFSGTELAGMTTGNQTRLQTIALYLASGVNPSVLDNRQFFDDVFSGAGGVVTRAALQVLWKRQATRIEKLFSAGTGSTPAPATMAFEGQISYQEIFAARA